LTTVESIRCYDRIANRRLTMDDLQGNVIDGTARARQWRLARSKARAESDGAEARSDAPKSIAGSLLVPADMLSMGVPGNDAGGGAENDATAVPTSPDVAVTRVPQNGTTHENPFLVPDAGRLEEDASVPARTRLRPIARLLTGTLARGLRRRDRHAHERFSRESAWGRRRHLRWATAMIAGVATLGVGALVVIGIAAGTRHQVAKAHHAGLAATASGQGAAWDSAAKLKVATVTTRERQARARTTAHRAATRQRQGRHETRRHPSSSPRHRAPASSKDASVLGVQASGTSTGSSDGSSVPTAETARAVTTAPVSAATTSTPLAPGPSGPGGTVGSNCNPKCS
jgi:hypothetical protein